MTLDSELHPCARFFAVGFVPGWSMEGARGHASALCAGGEVFGAHLNYSQGSEQVRGGFAARSSGQLAGIWRLGVSGPRRVCERPARGGAGGRV